jgi:hypothetical protein
MSEPQFIPSGKPHSVEMSEGSHVAKSKSGKAGTEVRRTEQDHFAHDQEIEVDAHHVHLQASSPSADNRVKIPRSDNIERAFKNLMPAAGAVVQQRDAQRARAHATEQRVYDTEMPEMNFPGRLIRLKIENDAVRAQLESLQSTLQVATANPIPLPTGYLP